MQTLWKYYTLRTVPEKDTALRILKQIKANKVIEELISEITYNTTDAFDILNNIGVLELHRLMQQI